MVRWKEPMFRTFGVTNLGPDKENRIIFYSILFLLLATGIYILTFYLGGNGKNADGKEQNGEASLMRETSQEAESPSRTYGRKEKIH